MTRAASMAEARFSDEMIAEMRAKVGSELRIEHSVWNAEATRLAILKFAAGIGDANPRWGEVAPPSFVIGCFSGLQFGWPGLGSFHSASDCRFHRPILRGDAIRARCTFVGFDGPKPSRFAPKIAINHFRNDYANQRGEAVATLFWSVIHFERGEAKQRGAERGLVLPHPWTEREAEAIDREVLAQAPRGATPRCYEEVREGDALDPLTKGPIGLTDEIAFVAGGGAPIPRLAAHRAALLGYEKHAGWAFRDPSTRAMEPIYAVHYNRHAANAMAVPEAYDVGFQRQCWQIQLLTNWIGDSGELRRASAQYRKFVYHGDVVRLGGRVRRVYRDASGAACVDLSTHALNQRGDDVMPGEATVVLPTRH